MPTTPSAVLAGRRAAEKQMRDQCIITRVVGETTDPNTGKVVPLTELQYPLGDQVGRCKLTSYEGYEQSLESAEASVTVQRLSIHLPVGAYTVRVGDIVELTTTPWDPLLTGRRYRVAGEAPFRSYATAYRIFVDYIAE